MAIQRLTLYRNPESNTNQLYAQSPNGAISVFSVDEPLAAQLGNLGIKQTVTKTNFQPGYGGESGSLSGATGFEKLKSLATSEDNLGFAKFGNQGVNTIPELDQFRSIFSSAQFQGGTPQTTLALQQAQALEGGGAGFNQTGAQAPYDPNAISGGRAALEQSLVSKGLPAPEGGFQTLTPTTEQQQQISNTQLRNQTAAQGVTSPQLQQAQAPSQAVETLGRKLGPTEYANLVRENNVTPENFDQYFTRQGNDIYLKPSPGTQQAQFPSYQSPSYGLSPQENQEVTTSGYQAAEASLADLYPISDSGQFSPINSFVDAYKQVYQQLGLSDVKTQFDALTKEFQDVQNELSGKIAEVSENPWLSESARQRKTNALKEDYATRSNVLLNRIELVENLFNRGQEEVQFITEQVMNEQSKRIELAAEERQKALDRAFKESEAERKAQESFELSPGQTRFAFNPKTGKFEAVANLEKGATDELLSPNEAALLGLPYGTTKAQAAQKGIVPKEVAGLSPIQQQNFLRISDKYQADEVIKNADRGRTTIDVADQVLANPGKATNQLKALYTLVKNLDPDSAVREGETALAQKTQSYLDTFKTTLDRVFAGKVISDKAAIDLANATKELAQTWFAAGQRRTSQYKSQANVAGIGEPFNEYLSGFESSFEQQESPVFQQYRDDPRFEGLSDDEIRQELRSQGLLSKVGADTKLGTVKLGSKLAIANNNPGNLRFVGQPGAVKGEGGFAKFKTPEAGVKALQNQIALDASRNLSLQQFIYKYAPPSENDSGLYLKQAIKALGTSASTKLSAINPIALLKFMALKESSTQFA